MSSYQVEVRDDGCPSDQRKGHGDTDWEGGSHGIIEVENDASHPRNQGQQKEWQAGVGGWGWESLESPEQHSFSGALTLDVQFQEFRTSKLD